MPFDQFKVNLDTPQPGGRQGESPRSAFTKYNDFLDAIALGEVVVGPNPPTETRAYGEWINTSVAPPMLMRRNGDNTEWVAIAPALAALATLAGDNEFSGSNSFSGDNEFSGVTQLAAFLLGQPDTELTRSEAGQVAVNGSMVYQRNNIVGTVSQSGGVPTGAIIESGSNASGGYVRFADGTQICAIQDAVPVFVNESNIQHDWTYPADFASVPTVVPQGRYQGFSAKFRSTPHFVFVRSITTSACTIGFGSDVAWVNGDQNLGESLNAIAFGRWF